ncbi:MAG: tRNA (N6-isopentenyl adenosine(37)-C2)-methylthiotransferase MiaB [Firmicutes bacterium]|nr:tRNA (N6-isopentenyl adenosine(37)-C2)-methylthiotransferase MiaB [Bacillota bacterium]
MNLRDAEVMAGILEKAGYERAEDMDAADVILVNTCAVRDSAERKIYGQIGTLAELKKKRPGLKIAVTGCLAQRPETPEKMLNVAPHVDLLFGTHNQHEVANLLERVNDSREMTIDVWDQEGAVLEHLPSRREDGLKAWVTIMYGCNNFCTYCVVPQVRGRERSRNPEGILREVRELGEKGYKEITLLGQNVNSYGKDLGGTYTFSDLLLDLDKVPGIERIRYMTSHPRDFSDRLIEVIAASRKVCEHFHLPIQSGSDEILRRMNRGYSREKYLELTKKIRRALPQASLSTDIIVGYGFRREEHFQETLELIQEARFDAAFTFIFSPRSGTPAAGMPEQIPYEVKKERLAQLMEVQNQISLEKNKAMVGKIYEVLLEGLSPKNPDRLTGRTRTNKIVLLSGPGEKVGQLASVKIQRAKTWTLDGELEG